MGLTRPRAAQIYDLDYKQATRAVTTSNYNLSSGAPAAVDGVSLSAGDRVLVTGQSSAQQNGLYYVVTVGTGADGVWARTSDTNETGEIDAGMIVMVTEGAVYRDTQWKLTSDNPIVIGTTPLTFVQNYSANSISAGTSNVVVTSNGAVTISSAGTPNVLTVNAGSISVAGNINTSGTLNINSTSGNYNVLNISGTALGPYGGSQTWKFFTQNITSGGPGSWILFPDSSTQTTAYPGTSSVLSLVGNITGDYIIGNGSQLTGLPAGYANSDVALYLASGDDTSNIITSGNVSGTYILGNVAFATGIPATYGNSNVAAYLASGTDTSNIITTGNIAGTYLLGNANIQYTASSTEPTGNLIGAQWYNTSNDVLYEWQTDGTSSYWIDISGPVIGSNGAVSGTSLINGTSNISIIANSNAVVSIGGTADIVVWATTGEYVTGVVSATGNITSTANITGGNLLTNGIVSASSHIGSVVSVTANITGGNLITGGLVNSTGNISGSNMIATGAIYSNYNTNTANVGSFMATGSNTKGGTGYLDFLVVNNTGSGVTNPYKWFRTDTAGKLEIINSTYTTSILNLTDGGNLSIAGQYQVAGKQAVNGPAFRAYIATNQAITSGSQQKVTFASETFDTNSNFSSSRFTPTVEGYYQLNATVRMGGVSGTGEIMITIWKNGSEYARGTNESGTEQGAGWYSMQVSDLAYANGSTDYFEIYIQQTSGSNKDTTAGQNISYFSGAMVRGA